MSDIDPPVPPLDSKTALDEVLHEVTRVTTRVWSGPHSSRFRSGPSPSDSDVTTSSRIESSGG